MQKPTMVKTNIPVLFMREGNIFICYTPAFDLAAHGDTFEDAKKSFEVTFKLFMQEVTRLGTWPKVLKEYGWKKVDKKYVSPQLIGQETRAIEIPAFA